MNICIKNVEKEDWAEFKAESAIHRMKAGEFLSKLVKDHKNSCKKSNWDEILYGEKTLKHLIDEKKIAEMKDNFRNNLKLRH